MSRRYPSRDACTLREDEVRLTPSYEPEPVSPDLEHVWDLFQSFLDQKDRVFDAEQLNIIPHEEYDPFRVNRLNMDSSIDNVAFIAAAPAPVIPDIDVKEYPYPEMELDLDLNEF